MYGVRGVLSCQGVYTPAPGANYIMTNFLEIMHKNQFLLDYTHSLVKGWGFGGLTPLTHLKKVNFFLALLIPNGSPPPPS